MHTYTHAYIHTYMHNVRLKEQEQECKAQLKKGRLNQKVCFSLMDSVLDATATRTSEVGAVCHYFYKSIDHTYILAASAHVRH